jgi:hypothetical protein
MTAFPAGFADQHGACRIREDGGEVASQALAHRGHTSLHPGAHRYEIENEVLQHASSITGFLAFRFDTLDWVKGAWPRGRT